MFHVVWLATYKQMPPKLIQMKVSVSDRNNQKVRRKGGSLYMKTNSFMLQKTFNKYT